MGWAWKVIGAGAGAALGGPIGAVVGTLLGHILDAVTEDSANESEVAAARVGGFLARLAYETGNFDQREKELIADICVEIAESSRLTREAVLAALPQWACNQELFNEVIELARQNPDARLFLLFSAWRVASRDNKVDENERNWIENVAVEMGDTDGMVHVIGLLFCRQADSQDAACREAYDVLGLPPTASAEEIRERYHELSKKYHPDRYPTAEPTLRELAGEKLAQINRAYELLRHRGSKQLVGLSPFGDKLFEPSPRAVVRCFFCGQKCRLPPGEANLRLARCPRCQVLLLFERTLASEWLEAFADKRRSVSHQTS